MTLAGSAKSGSKASFGQKFKEYTKHILEKVCFKQNFERGHCSNIWKTSFKTCVMMEEFNYDYVNKHHGVHGVGSPRGHHQTLSAEKRILKSLKNSL